MVVMRQRFGEHPELVQPVANAEDLLLLQEPHVVLHRDQQLPHLPISAKEHGSCAFPDTLAAVIAVFRAGFPEHVPQFGQRLLALLEDRL
jgi:hypothetical protein